MTEPTKTAETDHAGLLVAAIAAIKHSKLSDYGHLLPIGVQVAGSPALGKGFAFSHMDYEAEEKIDKARNKKGGPGSHPARVVTEVLATMLTEWGSDADFGTKNHVHKLAALQNSFAEDVLYAWICLRAKVMGAGLGIDWTCSNCDHEFPWQTDLNGLEVTVVDTMPIPVEVQLEHKIDFGPNKIAAVRLLPAKWAAVHGVKQVQRRGGLGDIRASMLRSSIYAVITDSGTELALSARVFQMMRKYDRERMVKVLDGDGFPRCDMRLEVECPECGFVQKTQLDWTWDFFFGSASLPGSKV